VNEENSISLNFHSVPVRQWALLNSFPIFQKRRFSRKNAESFDQDLKMFEAAGLSEKSESNSMQLIASLVQFVYFLIIDWSVCCGGNGE